MTTTAFHARPWHHVALVAIAAAALLPGAPVSASSSTKPYVLGTDEPILSATSDWAARVRLGVLCASRKGLPGIGGVCFKVPASASTARVRIDDVSGLRVSGTIRFLNSAKQRLASTAFCHVRAVAVPPGAATLVVAVHATQMRCASLDSAFGSAGHIAADFGP